MLTVLTDNIIDFVNLISSQHHLKTFLTQSETIFFKSNQKRVTKYYCEMNSFLNGLSNNHLCSHK